ncbi:DUF6318 family protein [Cellulomonas cellasea]|uniref:DUF6318 family protein n=1 Tax=Cellulomonas cellasea TaxID=43670 RepID=UPI0025A35A26|nr:DUF6318 family protein [Cellulomonas cellasea]MDM8083826.1 DUF6318 family protein [Cellulomonas cellasea]
MPPPLRPRPFARDEPRRRPSCAGVAALVLATTLGLAGCTQADERPRAEPTATGAAATPSLTPAPSPTRSAPPARPAAMTDATVDGAVAAATYFISLYPYVYNTGDLAEWNALSHPECIFCASVVDGVEEMHNRGNHSVGAEMVVANASAVELNPGHSFTVQATLSQGPTTEIDATGAVVSQTSATQTSDAKIVMFWEGDEWLVRALETSDSDG